MISLNEIRLKIIRVMLRYYHKFFSKGKVKVNGLTLFIEEGVFNPKYTFSSMALLNFLKSKRIRSTFRVIDVGTGTGIIAISICSTKKLKWVIASDINFQSIRVSLKNIKENGVYDYVDVIACDGLSPFRNSAVNLVVSNPPYLPLNPKNELDQLFCAGEKLEMLAKMIKQSRYCLKIRGALIFTISSLTPTNKISELLISNGFVYIRHQVSRTILDKIYVVDAMLISKKD